MKTKLHNRILSALLMVTLFVTSLAIVTFASDAFSITSDGKQVSCVEFCKNEKLPVIVENIPEDCTLQWQVRVPETDIWVDIHGQTGHTLELSYALLSGVLNSDGTADVRCQAKNTGDVYTAMLHVTVLDSVNIPGETTGPEETLIPDTSTPAEADTTPEITETTPGDISEISDITKDLVTITVEYHYEDRNGIRGDMVMDPYVAHVPKNEPVNIPVTCKVFPGYEIILQTQMDGISLISNALRITLDTITENFTIQIHYKETLVPYHARFFMQNIYNDLYTERTDILSDDDVEAMVGYAGDQPDARKIYPTVPGFSALFYQPDTIAADGSTVFEVYYDRNYYLINFDLAGGFGTAPVYARYETAFTVSAPTKPGYLFDGWELISGTVPDGAATNASGLVTQIPDSNLTYQARWTQEDTTYTVAYWILGDNGTSKTFLGNRAVGAKSGTVVHGTNDLSGQAICGYDSHEHSNSCMSCGHWHTSSCYSRYTSQYNPSEAEMTAMQALGKGEPEAGYIYALDYNGWTYYKIHLGSDESGNDKWNCWKSIQGTTDAVVTSSALKEINTTILDGTESKPCVVRKYHVDFSTNNDSCSHSHTDACQRYCSTNIHQHSDSCYKATTSLEYIDSATFERNDGSTETIATDKNVTVKGDGSTVVNVYYQYKEYTLKFYYAATTGGTDADDSGVIDPDEYTSVKIVGGSTYYFGHSLGTNTDDDLIQLQKMYSQSGQWGTVTELPTLTANDGARRGYTLGTLVDNSGTTAVTYHYISFKARYNDDISDMWPCGVFNAATRTAANSAGGWAGTAAFVSAWNGEHHVAYSRNGNETIKGIYEKLDDNLLFHSDYSNLSYNEVSFLCFWENGANVGWSVPELYIYNIWLPCPGNLEANAPKDPVTDESRETKSLTRDGKEYWYYLHQRYQTCDNSTISEQTTPAMTGYTYQETEWGAIFISQATPTTTVTDEDSMYAATYVGKGNGATRYNSTSNTLTDGNGWSANQTLKISKQTDSTYLLYDEALYDPADPADDLNHNIYREAYYRDYFYAANAHTLYFWNYDGYLTDGRGVPLTYGSSLQRYGAYVTPEYMKGFYPKNLEPNAYYFDGWYTSSGCLANTEMDWSGIMPDSDLTVYAKWTPKTYNTYFYRDYNRYNQGTYFQSVLGTEHGRSMVTSGIELIPGHDTGGDKYQFVGWFYIDEKGEKVAFNPSEMAVRQELHLFAEWATKILRNYTVSYKLGRWDEETGTVIPIEEGETGYRVLSPNIKGYAFEASTKTFTAKSEEMLENLTTDETDDRIWLPHTNSHSILMKSDNEENTFTFYYVTRENIPYTVRYLDSTTQAPLKLNSDGTEFMKTVDENSAAVVTEQFIYIPGYIPDVFHKTLVLSANETENVICFYYSKDESYVEGDGENGTPTQQSARYLITHYIQDIDSGSYSVYTTSDLIGIVDETVRTEALSIPGFTFSEEKTKEACGAGNVTEEDGQWVVSGTVTTGEEGTDALQLKLYYTRNKYGYTVNYLNAYTRDVVAQPEVHDALYDFGDTITVTAKTDIKGFDLFGSTTQTLKISATERLNTITFLYTPKEFAVNYIAVSRPSHLTGGEVLTTAEYGTVVNGTTAVAYSGFRFSGWYSDPECTDLITATYFYKPNVSSENDVNEYNFYALFEPITLTIRQTGMKHQTDSGIYEIVNESDQVIITVVITGNNSVTLEQIPLGTYTIREITSRWTWTYASTNGIYFTVTDTGNTVIFNHASKTVDWLHNESCN